MKIAQYVDRDRPNGRPFVSECRAPDGEYDDSEMYLQVSEAVEVEFIPRNQEDLYKAKLEAADALIGKCQAALEEAQEQKRRLLAITHDTDSNAWE